MLLHIECHTTLPWLLKQNHTQTLEPSYTTALLNVNSGKWALASINYSRAKTLGLRPCQLPSLSQWGMRGEEDPAAVQRGCPWFWPLPSPPAKAPRECLFTTLSSCSNGLGPRTGWRNFISRVSDRNQRENMRNADIFAFGRKMSTLSATSSLQVLPSSAASG